MIVNADVKSLEIHTAAYLSKDEILHKELHDRADLHSDNQMRFTLPSRRDAKFLIFRILFGGTAGGFFYDPNFASVKFSKEQWQDVVDMFYDKYKGIYKWHVGIVREAVNNGRLVMPTGRVYTFSPYVDNWGNMKFPETQVKNYPVQGLGADLMTLYRIALKKLIGSIKIISSVHDSVVVDCEKDRVEFVVHCMNLAADRVPLMFEDRFGLKYDLPFLVEVGVGKNLKELAVVH